MLKKVEYEQSKNLKWNETKNKMGNKHMGNKKKTLIYGLTELFELKVAHSWQIQSPSVHLHCSNRTLAFHTAPRPGG